MSRMKLIALTASVAAVVAGPVAAPAQAAENHPCELFADPFATVCQLPYDVYCLVFPKQSVCH